MQRKWFGNGDVGCVFGLLRFIVIPRHTVDGRKHLHQLIGSLSKQLHGFIHLKCLVVFVNPM